MSADELEFRLSQIKDKRLATEVRRFLLNIFLLFDNDPPPHIQTYIGEIMNILESQKVPVPIRLSRPKPYTFSAVSFLSSPIPYHTL